MTKPIHTAAPKDTSQSGLKNGSTKALTLFIVALLGIIVLVWSIILPVIGILYLAGKLP